jgi:xanthine dehydrogenase YagR molybdenum-binding subunit
MAERKFAWPARKDTTLIGREIPRIDAVEKCTGKAKYTADFNTTGTLFCRLVTSDQLAHGKIKKIDISAAEKIPGVRAIHLFKDVDDEVRWDGELIAAIAADRDDIAKDGAKAVIVEIEQLDQFVDEADLAGGEKAGRKQELGKKADGDVDAAIKAAKAVHKGKYGIVTISHMCLEPHGAHCQWDGDKLDVHLSTQNVSGTGSQFAEALEIDAANVTVTADYEGGGFGSKFQADEWGVACAELSKKTGKPVRLMLDRATELKVGGTRPSAFAEVTIAANADGKITAWDSVHWGTAGVGGGGVDVTKLPYVFKFENQRASQIGLQCNVGPNRAWRAPPHPQLCALTMMPIDDLAAKLGMDSYDLFLKNLSQVSNGKDAVYADQMKIAAEAIDWKAKWHPHGKAPEKGPVKRGLGMALHTWGGGPGACKCTVKVHPDGSVETFLGSQDIGTGTRTIIAITLAETFGLPLSAVKVNLGSSKYPQSAASGGSITVGGVSGANRRAAQTALWQIFDKVAEKYKVSADGLVAKGEKILSGDKEVCTWKQAASLLGPMSLEVQGQGPAKDGLTSDTVGGVQMVDLSVDTETGVIRIHKFVCVQDCGLILDEMTAKSQVYGGMIMGVAYALAEERVMDSKTGRFLNANLKDYALSRIGDIGELVAIMYQPDSEYQRGVVGLGEPPVIAPGAAISNAVHNAIGVRVPTIPLTPKRVLDALKGAKA